MPKWDMYLEDSDFEEFKQIKTNKNRLQKDNYSNVNNKKTQNKRKIKNRQHEWGED